MKQPRKQVHGQALALAATLATLGLSVGVDVRTALASSIPTPAPPEKMQRPTDRMKPGVPQTPDATQQKIDAAQQKLPSRQDKDRGMPGGIRPSMPGRP